MDPHRHADDYPMNVVDLQGDTLEESSAKFPTIGAALAAGTEQLQILRERDRPLPAQVPWHRRR
jgi:hypothetical protein